MHTQINNQKRIIKTTEVKFSNISFIVTISAHYMESLWHPSWSKSKYTATIKETGEGIGCIGGKKHIVQQMKIINDNYKLFIK